MCIISHRENYVRLVDSDKHRGHFRAGLLLVLRYSEFIPLAANLFYSTVEIIAPIVGGSF